MSAITLQLRRSGRYSEIEQVTGRGGGDGEARRCCRARVGECLQGEAVGDREEVGDDRLGVVAEVEHALALLRAQHLGDVGAGALEELADLVVDLGIAATGAEEP